MTTAHGPVRSGSESQGWWGAFDMNQRNLILRSIAFPSISSIPVHQYNLPQYSASAGSHRQTESSSLKMLQPR